MICNTIKKILRNEQNEFTKRIFCNPTIPLQDTATGKHRQQTIFSESYRVCLRKISGADKNRAKDNRQNARALAVLAFTFIIAADGFLFF